ncbi:DUF6394 family protein [Dichelobacter nodosus]|uniref:DUF6394 family protein n=1 Tax=Dichelobacter nodosus TaxID=870 RepID=UPI000E292D7F|nr:DUF6394 family protein [Dichelobacter nodosus]AXM45455.1 hypothetical protein DYQ38_02870 [Dichelobacter nodosus]
MRSERLWFNFFVLLALTLSCSFVYGELGSPEYHEKMGLFFAFVVSLICTVLKFGDRTQMGSLLMAASLVSDVQLLAAILVWTFSVGMLDGTTMATIVSFAAGAMVANIVSVILIIIETTNLRR